MNGDAKGTNQIKSERSTKTILVTGATGDTGRPTVKLLLERGHKVKALVRKDDERARALRDRGADVIVGAMLDISSMRKFAWLLSFQRGQMQAGFTDEMKAR